MSHSKRDLFDGNAGTEIVPATFALPVHTPTWTWRQQHGREIAPADMDTRHLFYTMRMIWNHSMPEAMHVGEDIKRYRFGSRHPPSYMQQAIVHIGAELFDRTDLTFAQYETLGKMAAHFAQHKATVAALLPGKGKT